MAILGSVILGTVTHTATGTVASSLYHLFNGSLTEARSAFDASGLFCSVIGTTTAAAFQTTRSLSITVGAAFVNVAGSSTASTAFPGFGGTTDDTLAGGWSISCPCERIIAWYDDSSYQDSNGFPTDGGVVTPDSPKRMREVIWDRPLTGGTLSCSATWAGLSASTAIVIAAADTQNFSVTPGLTITPRHQNSTLAGRSTQASGAFDGTAITYPSYNQTINSVTCTTSGSVASVSTDATNRHGVTQANGRLPRSWRGIIAIRYMNAQYPSAVTVDYTYSGGTTYANITGQGTITDTQRYGLVMADHNGTSGTASINEWRAIRMWIRYSGRVAANNGEDTRDWRLPMKSLEPWNAITLTQAGSAVLYSTAGTEAAGTISVTLPAASTDAGLQGASWDGASLCGYRYLIVEGKSGGNATLTIGSKQWTQDYAGNALNFGASYAAATVDLCCPNNGTAQSDTKDTRWPLSATSPILVADSELWGVSNADEVTLTSSGTPALRKLTLSRLGTTTAHITPTFDNLIPVGNGPNYRVDSLWAETDGRKSLETVDFYESAGAYTHRTIAQVANSINGESGDFPTDGFAGSVYADEDAFRGSARAAAYLGGGGATYHPSGGKGSFAAGWNFWVDKTLSGTPIIPAQLCVDEVTDWFPNTDSHGYGAGNGTALGIAACKIYRGGAWGIVYTDGDVAASGSAVSVTDTTDNDNGGSATTNIRGGYYSGTPFVQGEHSGRVSSDVASAVGDFKARHWHRYAFRVPGSAESRGVVYAVSPAGRHAIAYGVNGTIVFGVNQDAFGLTYGSATTGIAGTPTSLGYETGKSSRLYLTYTAGGSVFSAYTINEGAGWTMAGTVFTGGTASCGVYCRDGRKYYFGLNGGTIYARQYDSTDTAMGTAYPVVSGGVDADSIDAQEWYANKGQWRINLHYRSSGNLITVSSIDGVTFS